MPRLTQLLKTVRTVGAGIVTELVGGLDLSGPLWQPQSTLVYGPVVTPDASLGGLAVVTATNAVAFTIAAPINPPAAGNAMVLVLTVRNASGGALGALTFNAVFKLGAAWVQPANGFSRTISFVWNGTNWVEAFRSAADVAN